MKYFIANWKANKTLTESLLWVDAFISKFNQTPHLVNKARDDLFKIIICPPFPHIYPLSQKIKDYKNIHIGAQDVSNIEKGTYTGETTAFNLSGMVNYAIIGHSERRKHYLETQNMVLSKFNLAARNNINGFFCIGSLDDQLPQNIKFICWEPPESISTGDGKGGYKSLNDIVNFKNQIPLKEFSFIYGGSVNEDNAKEYTQSGKIDGFIIGGASLDPHRFHSLLNNAFSD